jgi:hypothetical protein
MAEDSFDRFLRTAAIDPRTLDSAALAGRVRKTITELTPELALFLVHLAHDKVDTADEAAIDWFGDAVMADDESLDFARRPFLLRLLAGASLITGYTSNRATRTVVIPAAMAVRCAAGAGWNASLVELLPASETFLDAEAIERRDPPLPRSGPPPPEEGEDATIEELQKSLNTALRALHATRRADREQREVLFWLLSAQPAKDDTRSAMVIDAAASLSSATQLFPPPLRAAEFLRFKLGSSAEVLTSFDDIAAAQTELRRDSLPQPGARIAGLCPRLRHLRGSQWDEAPASATHLEHARRLYDELQLVRAYGEGSE